MKSFQEMDLKFYMYWNARNGGSTFDKRTREGKWLIADVLDMNLKRFIEVGIAFNTNPALVCTSIKKRRKLFDFKYNN